MLLGKKSRIFIKGSFLEHRHRNVLHYLSEQKQINKRFNNGISLSCDTILILISMSAETLPSLLAKGALLVLGSLFK